ncbi:MAG: PadR family transcriptional regulator [Terriglobia bacterium]
MSIADNTRLFSGLIRLHVLYHASQGPVFGLEMIRELRRHGYELSAGTLYPLLHSMEKGGYLKSTRELCNGHFRRSYRVTPAGRRALKEGRAKVRELFGELFEEGGKRGNSGSLGK